MEKSDLQPWMDFFGMLRTYEEKGFLEVSPEKCEAYCTLPAVHALSEGDDPVRQIADGALLDTVRNIRMYAAWKSQEGEGFLSRPFALHVVGEDLPHDLLYTVLLTRHRPWWGLFGEKDKVHVFDYKKDR